MYKELKYKISIICIAVLVCLVLAGIYETHTKISMNAKALALYAYPAITDDKVLLEKTLSEKYISNIIRIRGSPGEYVPTTFVLHSTIDILSVMVNVSDLTGQENTIRKDSIDVKVVKNWYQAGLNVDETDNKQITPELLLSDDSLIRVQNEENYVKLINGTYQWISNQTRTKQWEVIYPSTDFPVQDSPALLPVDLEAGLNKQFWVTVNIPKDAGQGTYTGKIRISIPAGSIKEIEFNLEVLPIILSKPYLEYSIYYTGVLNPNWPQGSISGSIKSETQFEQEMQDLLNHGIPNPTVYQEYNQSSLEKVLTIRTSLGLVNDPIYFLGLEPWGYQPLDKVKQVIAFARNYGIRDVYFYGVDEAVGSELTAQRTSWEAIQEAGGKIFVAGNPTDVKRPGNFALMGDITDLLICRGQPRANEAALWHASGHKIFSYANPQGGMELPETYRRNYGLLLWQQDYDGAMNWAYQSGFGNIWNDFDNSSYRDEVFAYPTVNGVISTIQWEGFREGVNDIRYLTTLLDVIKVAKSQRRDTSAAETWLVKLKGSDLVTKNLDSVRDEMISQILSLQSVS
jgi:hypothetical protein